MPGGSKSAWLALALAALLLRAWGLGWGEPPIRAHPDELHYAGLAGKLSWSDLNPRYYENPPLLTYVLFGARELRALAAGEEANREWVRTGGLFRLSRWIGVLSGVATVLLVGAACRRLTGRDAAGFAAGAVVACSFLHGRDSHYGVNDVPMTALLALSLLWAVRACQGEGLRWARLSAVAAGLAAATKYPGAF
ncbi:MAG TPA: glycosyltransferase family 39 protein, partial [Planctomycetota bacterium]|nr:glycosyltransferase family 39 protein [Planctomycetota bacterium]